MKKDHQINKENNIIILLILILILYTNILISNIFFVMFRKWQVYITFVVKMFTIW